MPLGSPCDLDVYEFILKIQILKIIKKLFSFSWYKMWLEVMDIKTLMFEMSK